MHFITITKLNSVIVDYRVDNSVPEYWTTEALCAAVAADRGLSADLLETVSYNTQPQGEPGNFTGMITPNMHCLDTMTGLVRDNPAYIHPPFVRFWRLGDIRSALTLSERVEWDNDKTDTIKTAKFEFAQPQERPHTVEVLQFLVDSGDVSAASMQRILA